MTDRTTDTDRTRDAEPNDTDRRLDGDVADADVDGLSIDEAVAAVAGDDRDPEVVRSALARVAADGVLTRAAADDAVGEAAWSVATPETRVELASIALSDAREAAAPVADVDLVRTRLDGFETRVCALEERVDDLAERYQAVREAVDEGASLAAVALELDAVVGEGRAVQRSADGCLHELERFEAWVDDPDVRETRLGEDVAAVESMVDDLADAADRVVASDADGPVALADGERVDAAVAWADATMRHRMATLLVADLRAEAATLREWPGEDAGGLAAIDDRLDDLERETERVRDRLDDLARPAWRERFGDRIDSVERAFALLDPPVAWGEVQRTLERHRPREE
ncbi:MAG: halo transducer protein [Halosimplex sp.]